MQTIQHNANNITLNKATKQNFLTVAINLTRQG